MQQYMNENMKFGSRRDFIKATGAAGAVVASIGFAR
jgi:hypothetical protein